MSVQKYEKLFMKPFLLPCFSRHLGVSYHAILLFIAASIKPGLSLSALGLALYSHISSFTSFSLLASLLYPMFIIQPVILHPGLSTWLQTQERLSQRVTFQTIFSENSSRFMNPVCPYCVGEL